MTLTHKVETEEKHSTEAPQQVIMYRSHRRTAHSQGESKIRLGAVDSWQEVPTHTSRGSKHHRKKKDAICQGPEYIDTTPFGDSKNKLGREAFMRELEICYGLKGPTKAHVSES